MREIKRKRGREKGEIRDLQRFDYCRKYNIHRINQKLLVKFPWKSNVHVTASVKVTPWESRQYVSGASPKSRSEFKLLFQRKLHPGNLASTLRSYVAQRSSETLIPMFRAFPLETIPGINAEPRVNARNGAIRAFLTFRERHEPFRFPPSALKSLSACLFAAPNRGGRSDVRFCVSTSITPDIGNILQCARRGSTISRVRARRKRVIQRPVIRLICHLKPM